MVINLDPSGPCHQNNIGTCGDDEAGLQPKCKKFTPALLSKVGNTHEWLGTSDIFASRANGKPAFLVMDEEMFIPRTNASRSADSVSMLNGKACTANRPFFRDCSTLDFIAGTLRCRICSIGHPGTVHTNCFSAGRLLFFSTIDNAFSIIVELYF